MAALQYQQAFNLGAADHVAKISRAHRSNIAIATQLGEWRESVMSKPEAIAKAAALELAKVQESFVSQNPIGLGKSRSVYNISCLANVYVDLDVYKVPTLAGMEKADILSLILNAFPDMPRPTMFADSGRGMYLVWTFKSTKTPSFLPAWQQIEDALITLLEPFGVDKKCRDASRVLRIANTENIKSMSSVVYQEIGDPVRFEELQKYTNGLRKQWREKKAKTAPRKSGTVAKRTLNFTTKNEYTLHQRRMQDIRKLAELRGGLSDLRKTAAFCYALSAAWYCPTVESLNREVGAFINECFVSPEKYQRLSFGPAKRKRQNDEGVRLTWNGREYDARYRMKNKTLIEWLQITPEEQRHMLTIISSAEKNRRLTEKRRAAGVRPREEYVGAAKAKAEAVRRLAQTGATRAMISEQLGININTVKHYLKRG